MHSASIKIEGTNYKIISESIQVINMEKELEKISKFVKQGGGSLRSTFINPHKKIEFEGYYNGLSFRSEFFFEGVLINLSGSTIKEQKYFVNPLLRDLDYDVRHGGVFLRDIEKYSRYAKERSLGLNEQNPKLSDGGVLVLTLEGAVRHLTKDSPEFYAVTGLPKEWTPSLKLL